MTLKNPKKRSFRFPAGILVLLGLVAIFIFSCEKKIEEKDDFPGKKAAEIKVDGSMDAVLTPPPFVPEPVGSRPAKHLVVKMEILEMEGTMTGGVTYTYWTFGGTVPGSFIRARVGDEIEFHLRNHPDNKLPHNIDLHAVNGPGGGANSSFVAPGREAVFNFKVLQPGLYVYHCATAPVGMHIANGMYGLILVEPEGGLPPVDKEFYVMQGDFYTKGAYGEHGLQPFDMKKAIDEKPDYVVFNGAVGALTGDNALNVTAGETVRLFVGNGGPNLASSFHAIGEIFDKVYVEGADMVNTNVQTTLIPAGGAAIVEFYVDVPGEIILVDHSIFRAFNKGALAMINVGGEPNKTIYSGKIEEGIYLPEGGGIQSMPLTPEEIEKAKIEEEPLTKAQRIERGKNVYMQTCFACHQNEGQGVPDVFPPLAKSDYLNADVNRAIDAVLYGLSGEITVNGKKYNNVMTAQNVSDREAANVLTYVFNNWGNNGTEVTEEMIRSRRK